MARILALDPDDLVRRAIDRILRRHGHEVFQAAHEQQALRLAQDLDFDIAIVDFQLPGANGVAVLEKLRAVQPRCMRMLTTGHLDLPMVKGALNQGAVSRVIEKPLDRGELVDAIDAAMNNRRRMRDVWEAQRLASLDRERLDLDECLGGDSIAIALQPIVQAGTGQILAHEALLRSTHPTLHGPLPVINAAETHGRLAELGEVIVDRVRGWMPRLPSDRLLFMNLHPDELADPAGMAARLKPLARYAHRIVLEITERSQVTGLEYWEESVARVTEMGFALAVDDLGAGYSSLAVLAELQPRFIKVDMSIVRGVDADQRKQRLINLLVRFADATDAQLVAEGVETKAEAEALRKTGAHLLQGYYFGRPTQEASEILADPIAAIAPA
jgi:EAL domain-containing protein (putative c-di-GMP-specific phosphodiesterase class I)